MNKESPWRSSALTPFMGHIGFYLYDCGANHPSYLKHHYVKLTVNELEISLPGYSVFCPYADFWNMFADQIIDTVESICDRYSSGIQKVKPMHEEVLENENSGYVEVYIFLIFIIGISTGLIGKTFWGRAFCKNNTNNNKRKNVLA